MVQLTELPVEVVQTIYLHAVNDLPALSQTCKYFHTSSFYDKLWKKHCLPLYEEIGYTEREIASVRCYRDDYWCLQNQTDKILKLLNSLSKVQTVEERQQLVRKITDYGPRARLALKSTSSDQNQNDANELLDIIIQKRALNTLSCIAETPEDYSPLDVFLTLYQRFPQQSGNSALDELVNFTLQQLPDMPSSPELILQTLTTVQTQQMQYPIIRSSTTIHQRKYRSLVHIFAYSSLLRRLGYSQATPLVYPNGLKWDSFIQINNDSYVSVSWPFKQFSKNELELFKNERDITWASMKEVACSFIKIMSQTSAPKSATDNLVATMEALFETKGSYFQWKSPSSIKLLNPEQYYTSSRDNKQYTAKQMACAFVTVTQH